MSTRKLWFSADHRRRGLCRSECRTTLRYVGGQVNIVDKLSRRGADDNRQWLKAQTLINFEKVDSRGEQAKADVVGKCQPPRSRRHCASK